MIETCFALWLSIAPTALLRDYRLQFIQGTGVLTAAQVVELQDEIRDRDNGA